MIDHIDQMQHLVHLEEFWANHNKLDQIDEVSKLACLPQLHTVYFEGNPIEKSTPQYRLRVKMILPKLKQIDALLTRPLNFLPDDRSAM